MLKRYITKFSPRPQQYDVEYCCLLSNKSSQANKLFIVLPIPKNSTNQKLLTGPSFSIKPNRIDFDNKYNNKYGVWGLVIGAGESIEIKQNFTVEVKAVRHKLKNKLTIESYDKDEEYRIYTVGNGFVNVSDNRILDLACRITKSKKRAVEIIKSVNHYIVNNLRYGEPIAGLYTAIQAIEKDSVDCGGFSVLFVSVCIVRGIPAKVVSGFWAGHNNNTMHAWVEILLPDKTWVPADPAVEQLRMQGRTKKFGKFGFVGNDRIVLSVGCDIPVFINKKEYRVPILQNAFVVAEKERDLISSEIKFKTKKSRLK